MAHRLESLPPPCKPVNHLLKLLLIKVFSFNAVKNKQQHWVLSCDLHRQHIYLLQCTLYIFSIVLWLSVSYMLQGQPSVASGSEAPLIDFVDEGEMGPSVPDSWVHSWRDRQWQLTHHRALRCGDGWMACSGGKKNAMGKACQPPNSGVI